MNTAEYDHVALTGSSYPGKLKRIADNISDLLHLVPLIIMRQDKSALFFLEFQNLIPQGGEV
jgi:hypothetical protein